MSDYDRWKLASPYDDVPDEDAMTHERTPAEAEPHAKYPRGVHCPMVPCAVCDAEEAGEEPVAWMYFPHEETLGPAQLSRERVPDAVDHYTESPLYSAAYVAQLRAENARLKEDVQSLARTGSEANYASGKFAQACLERANALEAENARLARVIEALEDALMEAVAIAQSTILVRIEPPRGQYLDGKFNRLSDLSKLAAAAYERNRAKPEDGS